MAEQSAHADVEGLVARALLWLQLLALALGALHFAFAPNAVQYTLIAAAALAALSEATLLGAMETAGRLVDDEELKEALKEKGLGTPATRAATIETLLTRR